MKIQRIVASMLAVVLTLGAAPVLAQQAAATGVIRGVIGDRAKQPYSDWVIQIRDTTTGQVVNTSQITALGTFNITGLTLARPYLVELVQVQQRTIACTQGPFTMTAASPSRGPVNMSCNKTAQNLSLLAAGLGTAAAVALTTKSSSK